MSDTIGTKHILYQSVWFRGPARFYSASLKCFFFLYKIHRCCFRAFIMIIIELLSGKAEGTGMCYFDLQ